MRAGLVRKLTLLIVLWTLYITAYNIIPFVDTDFINPFSTLETGVNSAFILYEATSLLENLGALGVEIPDSIKKHFTQLKEQDEKRKLSKGGDTKDEDKT